MWRTFLMLTLIVSAGAQAQTVQQQRQHPERRWETKGWRLFTHHDPAGRAEIVALNPSTTQVELLDARTGQALLSDQLDTDEKRPRLLTTLSTQDGRFLVAFARNQDHVVELHSVGEDASYDIDLDDKPISLQLVQTAPGEIYLVTAISVSAKIYRLGDDGPQVLQRVTDESGLRQVQAVSNAKGELVVEVFSKDGKTHVFKLSPGQSQLDEDDAMTTLSPQGWSQSQTDARGNILLANVSSRHVQMSTLDGRQLTNSYPVDLSAGYPRWTNRFFGFARRQGPTTYAYLFDASDVNTPHVLAVGDARQVSDFGQIDLKEGRYYFCVADHNRIYFENDNEASVNPAPTGERIDQVLAVNSNTLAVLTENASGSRLQLISSLAKATAPQTVDNSAESRLDNSPMTLSLISKHPHKPKRVHRRSPKRP